MEIGTMTLGFVGLAAVAVSAIVVAVARRRRWATSRFVERSPSSPRRRSWSSSWYASDPVLFVGGDVAADCVAGADGGGGGCA